MITVQMSEDDAEWLRHLTREPAYGRTSLHAALTAALGGVPSQIPCPVHLPGFTGTHNPTNGRLLTSRPTCGQPLKSEDETVQHLITAHNYTDDPYGEDTAYTNAYTIWRER